MCNSEGDARSELLVHGKTSVLQLTPPFSKQCCSRVMLRRASRYSGTTCAPHCYGSRYCALRLRWASIEDGGARASAHSAIARRFYRANDAIIIHTFASRVL